jgi:SNF2 family DNA or RNA helicase
LLLYHGLGSGKTCTSIAIAEGMKSHRKIFIMTPASLKMNFFSELKKCGDSMYKKKQYWEFVSTQGQPQNIPILSKALSLPVDFIMKHKGAWLMDTTKPQSNYGELTGDQQKMLDEQLNAMIRTKYVDINYNGLNDSRLAKMFTDENGVKHNPYDTNYKYNPFDNSVVMIDEAHNFVSRVSNKLNAHKSISYVLYNHLLRADNVRIVLMTGTPMINYPNELGILFNLLRGLIRTWTFTISGNQRLVKDHIIDMFRTANFNTYDYIDGLILRVQRIFHCNVP